MVTQVAPNLYRIPVPLPGNPLRNLNAYLIRGDRNLLVDTGFRQEECRTALKAGLAELGVDMANTDIFLTHLHSRPRAAQPHQSPVRRRRRPPAPAGTNPPQRRPLGVFR